MVSCLTDPFILVVIRWINECMGRTHPYLIEPILLETIDKSSFFTDLASMSGTDDQDLDSMAVGALTFIPECSFPHSTSMKTVDQALQTVRADILNSDSFDEDKTRRIKLLALGYLQVFFFRHFPFVFDGTAASQCVTLVSDLLRDPSLEVRQMASMTLSGLVRCSRDETVIEQLLVGHLLKVLISVTLCRFNSKLQQRLHYLLARPVPIRNQQARLHYVIVVYWVSLR